MLVSRNWFTAALVGAVLAATPAAAQDARREDVHFARGASSANLSGRVTGRAAVEYVVRASEGQTMSVRLRSANPTTYFNLTPPGGDGSALYNGSVSGASFRGTLPASGAYIVTVYQMGGRADSGRSSDYRLTVSVTGGAAQAAAQGGGAARGAGPYTVTGLPRNDTLSIRRAPNTSAAVVARVGDGRLMMIDRCEVQAGREWCHGAPHSDASQRGWMAGRYLRPQ